MDNLTAQRQAHRTMLETLGKYAPAFGIIGTFIGLAIVLSNMGDLSKIGPGVTATILTILCIAALANAWAIPLAGRLERRTSQEVLARTIIINGILAIQSGDSPRVVEQKLRALLPPPTQKIQEQTQEQAA